MHPPQVMAQLTPAPVLHTRGGAAAASGCVYCMVSVVQLTAPTQVSTAHDIGTHR